MAGDSVQRRACGACRTLRKKCVEDCIFAPHFPAEQQQKFAAVNELYGAHYVQTTLKKLEEVNERAAAVESMVYEANARRMDPIHGCYGEITALKELVHVLWEQLMAVRSEVQLPQSQVNYRNEGAEVEQIRVMLSNLSLSAASPSNSGSLR